MVLWPLCSASRSAARRAPTAPLAPPDLTSLARGSLSAGYRLRAAKALLTVADTRPLRGRWGRVAAPSALPAGLRARRRRACALMYATAEGRAEIGDSRVAPKVPRMGVCRGRDSETQEGSRHGNGRRPSHVRSARVRWSLPCSYSKVGGAHARVAHSTVQISAEWRALFNLVTTHKIRRRYEDTGNNDIN